jgi:hypothetical protein
MIYILDFFIFYGSPSSFDVYPTPLIELIRAARNGPGIRKTIAGGASGAG